MLKGCFIIFSICLLICCGGCKSSDLEEIPLDDIVIAEEQAEETKKEIYVYVCGAVKEPGVYKMQENSRAYEAIQAAGGFLDGAAEESVNQASIIDDEMTIYIPTEEEILKSQRSDSGKININTATQEELMELPGVGEAKAKEIISYRNVHGSFKQIEDIMSISGIKEGLFEKIKEYITV